jgi:hypothetical protein
MKTIDKTKAYETQHSILLIESISYISSLWAIIRPENTKTLIKSISYPTLLYYYGFPLRVSIMPLFNPNRFLDTPPPIIQNECGTTY